MENIYGVDIFIAAVLIISAVLSFFRGFISEMLGIGSWMVALLVGVYLMPYLEPFVIQYVPKPLFANILSLVCVSIITLIILTLICSKITVKVRKSALNRLDHFLGFIFGLLRGVVILVLIYFLVMTLAPKSLVQMQKKSRAFPYLERVTESVKEHMPESLFDNPSKKEGDENKEDELGGLIEKLNKPSAGHKEKAKKPAVRDKKAVSADEEEIEKPVDPEKRKGLFDKLNAPEVKEKPSKAKAEGYNKKEREELDKLFLESVEEVESVVD